MIFDTDIFVWIERGNRKAAALIEKAEEPYISIQTYMELLQSARNRKQQEYSKGFLREFGIRTLPFSGNIGHRAAVYIEEYSLAYGLRAGDAIIAATAAENNLPLCSGNAKHFKPIADLKLKVFKP